MKTRFLCAIVCAMIMIACPVFCVASDATDNSEDYATVKVSDLKNAAVEDLFNNGGTRNYVNGFVFQYLERPLCINEMMISALSKVSSDYSDFDYEAGRKSVVNDDKENITLEFFNISFAFSIVLKNDSSYPLPILSVYDYSGEGVVKMTELYYDKTLDEGETLSIEGKISVAYSIEYNGELFKNNSGDLYTKRYSYVTLEKQSYDVKVKIGNNDAFNDKGEINIKNVYDVKFDIVNGTESTYTPDKWQMRSSTENLTATSSCTKTFGDKSYPYGLSVDHYSYDTGQELYDVELRGVETIECKYDRLEMLYGYDNENEVEKKVNTYSGKADHTASDFNDTYSSVLKSFGVGDTNYVLWGIVVLCVVLLAIAGVICYKLYIRKEQ